jgi:hypothetical protein
MKAAEFQTVGGKKRFRLADGGNLLQMAIALGRICQNRAPKMM